MFIFAKKTDQMDWTAIFSSIRTICKASYWINKIKYNFNYYARAPIRVIIFGESGVGKTQFINSLLNRPESTNRTRQIEPSTMILSNGRKVVLFDTPGHQSLKQERYRMAELITKKKIKGIINVVNYGYNEVDTIDAVKIFTEESSSIVKDEYLKENRKREISQLDDWLRHINAKSSVQWVITVINKADIWFENQSAVLAHYEEGEYGIKLRQLSTCCHVDTYEYCSVISPFYDRPMTILIGDSKKRELRSNLEQGLINLIKRNGEIAN